MKKYGSIFVPDTLYDDISKLFDYSEYYSGSSYEELEQSVKEFVVNNDVPRYLYVVRCETTQYYKIGIANDVKKRISTHQTGCPLTLKLVFFAESDLVDHLAREIIYLEKFLHKSFQKQRVRGEWFELTYDNLADIVEFLEEDRELEVFHSEPSELSVYFQRIEEELAQGG
ncbi:GIY-YIG nuclease family protein [Vibrio splendidus]|uniref:GIY-YIG nuclease family protein n=1 Tax=Vibrio splendidus TaxID=29497 RepID=UPI0013B3FAF3|nr:GIY-YIG nuclease family protein [Vibrio splendidus]